MTRARVAARRAGELVRRHRPDYKIIMLMGILMMLGLVVMYAIGPSRANALNSSYGTDFYSSTYFFLKQSGSLIASLLVFALVSVLPVSFFAKNATKFLLAGMAACALLLFFGDILHVDAIAKCTLGACRWFSLGPVGTIQPAEILKFGLLIYLAVFLADRIKKGSVNDWHDTIMPVLVVLGISAIFVILFQKDLGTGLTILCMAAVMLFVSDLKWSRIGALALLGLVAIGVLIVAAPHRMERVATFLSGDNHAIDDAGGYHIAHAKMAIGSGGLFGVGIGNSVEATGYLPEAINDSVFAIMGETFGFVGLVAIMSLFAFLLLRLIDIFGHLSDPLHRLMVAGVFGWLASHVFLNIGAMIGLIPLTGITLPLLSFGGTSMMFIAGALGLAYQLSRYTSFSSKLDSNEDENSKRWRRVGRTRYSGRSGTPRN
ncbi:FtsW/RodA/SpoVE family cell cycle protein [Candidatus Saccharibacteria bacterium]|nr:FtsW/RodA/SpoVE family cell cycle protein [Candidatus Saccharibacteria bacterium]